LVYRVENGTAYFKTVISVTEAMVMNVGGLNALIKITSLLQGTQIIMYSHVVAGRRQPPFFSLFSFLFVREK